jgi:hypothetical protein
VRWILPWQNHSLREPRVHHRPLWRPERLPHAGRFNAVVMDSARGGPLPPQRTKTRDTVEGFPMAPNGERRTDLPSPWRHDAEVTPASTMTTPKSENTPIDQATMTNSTMAGDTTAERQPPPQATTCLSGGHTTTE